MTLTEALALLALDRTCPGVVRAVYRQQALIVVLLHAQQEAA